MVAEQPVASASKREADGGMDSELKEAAIFGNVDLLRKALDSKPTEYFLSWAPPDLCYQGGNIFHLVLNRFGSCCNPLPFIREAILRLPKQDVQLLLSQQETRESSNPLHLAACWGCLEIIQLMLSVYKSDSNDPITEDPPGGKPWLACQSHGATPLHMALVYNKEGCALEILSMDMELLCTMLDKNGWDPLYIAVHNGLNVFVAKILESDCSYNVIGEMFEGVVKNCSKEVWGIMYKKHSELLLKTDQHDFSFLHYWVYIGKSSWLLQLLEEVDINALENLSRSVDQEGNTPLHAAVNHGYQEFASYLVEKCTPLDPPLWRCENKDGITPLDMALRNRDEDLAFLFISKDSWTYIEHDSHWQSRLFLAIEAGMDRVVQQICSCVAEGSLKFRIAEYSAFSRIGTTNTDREQPTLLHLVLKCQDTTAKLLLKTFPYLVFNERYPNKKTTIEMTSEVGPEWLTKLLITEHPSSIKSSPNVWITLCGRGHVEALEAFIKYHPDFKKLCIAEQDSPLHHIKLASYQDYEKFLKVPFIWEMRNSPDNEGKTPLHWALERKDILLAEVLLKNGVDRNIRDKKNQSAAKLLAKLCKRDYEWDKMSRRLGINPRLQNLGSSATEMRTTLSVVAALLATLTFAAAFTIPGGFNQDTGEAILATKAYFIVFILADTYAMCCAMLALFCLVWSIVSDQHESQVLIDRSVLVLVHSFYGTLMAFVTGIYAVIHQKSLWAAILVLFMCSLVAIISSRKSFLYKLLDKLVPTIDRKKEKECVV